MNGSTLWKPPPIWEGETVYIIGGGPSVNDMPLELIHNKKVIGVNNSYLLGNWVDVCWWGDLKWWLWHRKTLLTKFHGLLVTCNTKNTMYIQNKHWVRFMGRGTPTGIETRAGYVAWNKNSGTSAINLAYHFGAKTIVIVGFDMCDGKGGKTHWHGGHEQDNRKGSTGKPKKRVTPYSRFVKSTTFIARDAKKLGITILNASPVSTINAFPKVRLEDAL